MTAVYYTLGVLIFVIALLISVPLHECGHMIPAKRFGVRVSQFFVGLGKTVWSKTKGETEYGFKAIPLGGYVKLIGMLPPDPKTGEVRESSTGIFSGLIEASREAEWEQVKPEDEGRLFYQLVWWKRVIVMAGGPFVNILIAFLIFAGIFATYGNPADRKESLVLSYVAGCVVPAAEDGRQCQPDDQIAPAKAAGLEKGDRLLTVDGEKITSWTMLTDHIRDNANDKITLTYERDGQVHTPTTNPTVAARPDLNDPSKTVQVGFLGVSPTIGPPVTGGPIYTLGVMGDLATQSAQALLKLPVSVYRWALRSSVSEKRDPNGPVSIVGGGRIAGRDRLRRRGSRSGEGPFAAHVDRRLAPSASSTCTPPPLAVAASRVPSMRPYAAASRAPVWAPRSGYWDEAKIMPLVYGIAATLMIMGVVLIVGDLVVPISTT
ncbi:MAG: site-2 protease family protein [Marmoricola sp.]